MRHSVSIAAGGGMSHEEMSIALGISRPTLEKHFELELATGSLKKRMDILKAMHTAAKKGNVAAQKAYLSLTPTPAVPAPLQPSAPAATPIAKPVVLGKKDQANEDAKTAAQGTSWEALLGPKAPVQ